MLSAEMPAKVIPTATDFLRPFQRVDRHLKRQTIVLVVAAVGNVDRRYWPHLVAGGASQVSGAQTPGPGDLLGLCFWV